MPLKPSVDKILNLFYGLSKLTYQEISMYHSVNVDHKSMAAHLTRSECEGL